MNQNVTPSVNVITTSINEDNHSSIEKGKLIHANDMQVQGLTHGKNR